MEWWRLDSGSQVFSAEKYPFHTVRYNHRDFRPLCERIASISYSFLLSMMSGGGFENARSCALVE